MSDLKPGWVGSVTNLAVAMEVSRQTAHDWVKKPDFPEAVEGCYSVRRVAEWRLLRDQELERKRSGPAPTSPNSDDPLLNAGDSVGLERYRMAKAQLAELDLAEREKVMLSADAVHDGLAIIAQSFRKACEALQRKFGAEAFLILDESVKEAETKINDMFRDENDDAGGEVSDS